LGLESIKRWEEQWLLAWLFGLEVVYGDVVDGLSLSLRKRSWDEGFGLEVHSLALVLWGVIILRTILVVLEGSLELIHIHLIRVEFW
jgi:hypothetical protein